MKQTNNKAQKDVFRIRFQNKEVWQSKTNSRAEAQIRQGFKLSEEDRLLIFLMGRVIFSLCVNCVEQLK